MNRLMKWLLALGAVITAHAQTTLTATIPFDFIVNGRTLPAGDYHVGHSLSPDALSVLSQDTNAAAFVLTQPVQTRGSVVSAKLVFHRYGNRYFLYQVWAADSHYGVEIQPSTLERELIARKEAPSKSIVAAR